MFRSAQRPLPWAARTLVAARSVSTAWTRCLPHGSPVPSPATGALLALRSTGSADVCTLYTAAGRPATAPATAEARTRRCTEASASCSSSQTACMRLRCRVVCPDRRSTTLRVACAAQTQGSGLCARGLPGAPAAAGPRAGCRTAQQPRLPAARVRFALLASPVPCVAADCRLHREDAELLETLADAVASAHAAVPAAIQPVAADNLRRECLRAVCQIITNALEMELDLEPASHWSIGA